MLDLEDVKLEAGMEAGVKDTRRVQTDVESTGLRDAFLTESSGFCAPSPTPSGQVPSTRSLSPPRPQHGRCACHGKSARRDKTKVDQRRAFQVRRKPNIRGTPPPSSMDLSSEMMSRLRLTMSGAIMRCRTPCPCAVAPSSEMRSRLRCTM